MSKKTAILFLVIMVFTTTVCLGAPQKVKITFWDENAGPSRTPYLQEMINQFNKNNPGIEVEYVGLPWSASKQKIDVAIAADNTPDCSGISTNWVSEYALNRAIIPLDSFFNKAADRKKFIPVHLQGLRELVPNRKLYVLPNSLNANLFWYNPSMFKAAGVNPPKTWNEFFNVIPQLTDKNKKIYGFSIRGGSGSVNNLEMLLYAYSGLTDYFDKRGHCTVNNPAHLEFLKKYVALYDNYTPQSDLTNGYKEMVASFDNGITAMIMHNIGSYGEHVKTLGPGGFAALAFPLGKNGKRTAITAIKGYVIYKNSKHPAETWQFIHYMCSAESQSYWNKTIGQLPTREDVYQEPWVSEQQHLKLMGQIFEEKNSAILKNPQFLPDYGNIIIKLESPFQEVLLKQRTPESFLNLWAADMDKAYADYQKVFKKN